MNPAGAGRAPHWLNRNVLGIGLADFMADSNYEMALSVLPLFLVFGLGAPVYALGLTEGVADGFAAVFKLGSGYLSDRSHRRKQIALAGYGGTAIGFGLIAAVTVWPQVVGARTLAWISRGARQPIRSAMLAGSVGARDLGKAFGFHEAMDTLGAVAGPTVALLLLAGGHGFRSVFLVSLVPGVLTVVLFGLLTRDPRRGIAAAPLRWEPMPGGFWRLVTAIAAFGIADFAPTFFTLRAAGMMRQHATEETAVLSAIGFYLALNLIGAAASFPGGWLSDRFGKKPVLAAGYALFAVACAAGALGDGLTGVVMMAVPAGIHAPLVKATEQSFVGSIIADRLRGTAFGITAAVNGVGDLVSSVAVGIIWTAAGPRTAFAYGGVLAAVATALLLALVRGPARREGAANPSG